MGISVTLRGGSGDMPKSVYDPNLDGVIALAQLDVGVMRKTADSDLAMGAHSITLGAGQLVDGKDLSEIYIAHDAEVTEGGAAYVKKKTITLTQDFKGQALVTFETKHSTGGATAHARVYKNGVAIGTQMDTQLTSYQKFAEIIDFITVLDTQTIELWIYPNGGSGTAYAKNFRVYFIVGATLS